MSKLRHTVHTSRTIADNLIFCGTSKPLEIQGQFLGPVNRKASSICPRKVQKDSSGLKPGECVQLCSGLSFQVMMKSGGQSPCFPFSVESNIGNPRNVPTPGQRVEPDFGEASLLSQGKLSMAMSWSSPSPAFCIFVTQAKEREACILPAVGFQLQLRVFNSCLRRKMNVVPKNRKRFAGLKENALKW